MELKEEIVEPKQKEPNKSTSLINRFKGNKTKKQKEPKQVQEANVDNWFFKNFGLGKLFEEDEDQPM